MWIEASRRVHIGFPDPATATGTEDEIMGVFRNVRDDIATRYLWPRYLWRQII